MEKYTQLDVGQVVRSITGRDKGKIQLVIGHKDSSHVLVVDGKRRVLSNPKLKNVKHLKGFKAILELTTDLNDCKIRKMLKSFEQEN